MRFTRLGTASLRWRKAWKGSLNALRLQVRVMRWVVSVSLRRRKSRRRLMSWQSGQPQHLHRRGTTSSPSSRAWLTVHRAHLRVNRSALLRAGVAANCSLRYQVKGLRPASPSPPIALGVPGQVERGEAPHSTCPELPSLPGRWCWPPPRQLPPTPAKMLMGLSEFVNPTQEAVGGATGDAEEASCLGDCVAVF